VRDSFGAHPLSQCSEKRHKKQSLLQIAPSLCSVFIVCDFHGILLGIREAVHGRIPLVVRENSSVTFYSILQLRALLASTVFLQYMSFSKSKRRFIGTESSSSSNSELNRQSLQFSVLTIIVQLVERRSTKIATGVDMLSSNSISHPILGREMLLMRRHNPFFSTLPLKSLSQN